MLLFLCFCINFDGDIKRISFKLRFNLFFNYFAFYIVHDIFFIFWHVLTCVVWLYDSGHERGRVLHRSVRPQAPPAAWSDRLGLAGLRHARLNPLPSPPHHSTLRYTTLVLTRSAIKK